MRGVEERFESRLLPLFVRRTETVAELLPTLYLHGLSLGDFELALRGLLGDGAPLSGGSVARLKAKWAGEYALWNSTASRGVGGRLFVGRRGVCQGGIGEGEGRALSGRGGPERWAQGLFSAITPGFRESTESWSAVLRDLKKRGLRAPRLVVGDGHLGIWGGLAEVYPEAEEQRCWNQSPVKPLG